MKNSVNAFFKPLHNKIGNFATAPYSGWNIFSDKNLYEPYPDYQRKPTPPKNEWKKIGEENTFCNGEGIIKKPCYQHEEDEDINFKEYHVGKGMRDIAIKLDVAAKILLSPVLLPATVVTMAFALIAEVITGLAHLASLGVATIADAINPDIESTSIDSNSGMSLLTQ